MIRQTLSNARDATAHHRSAFIAIIGARHTRVRYCRKKNGCAGTAATRSASMASPRRLRASGSPYTDTFTFLFIVYFSWDGTAKMTTGFLESLLIYSAHLAAYARDRSRRRRAEECLIIA